MTNHRIAKFCALAAGIVALPVASHAGTEAKETKAVVEKAKESCITGDLGVNIVSEYISHGFVYENQGGIIQPYADLYIRLYQGDGFLNKVTLNLGIWDSFQSRKTDAGIADDVGIARHHGSTTDAWYEQDFTPGVSFTFAKNFTFTPSYYAYLSPSDAFLTFQGLNLKLAYDDTDLLGKFALHPYVNVLFELENKVGLGPDEGVYYEVGIAPSCPVGPVTLSVPLTVAFGSNGFYGSVEDNGSLHNEPFGFFSAGLNASYAMKFIPECYGTWALTASYTYYYLGNGTVDFNTDRAGGDIRDRNHNEHVFSGGVAVAF
jgi:hypothetical protein